MATNHQYNPKKKNQYSVSELTEGITKGNRLMLSRAITLLEGNREDQKELASNLLAKCLPFAGNSVRIGITGVPGVGKSTFIESFGQEVIRNNHKVAILAIDPSSALHKGSILGDKTRMNELSLNPNAFIRPTPSVGTLGGVANKTRESILLCEAAGFDYILIETVGVGQSEVEVHSMVDCFVLLLLAGAGDDLQGIKRGIMEMANLFVINKADGNNEKKARQASVLLKSALHLFPIPENKFLPEVLLTSSTEGSGINQVFETIEIFRAHTHSNGWFEANRQKQNMNWFESSFRSNLIERFLSNEENSAALKHLRKEVGLGLMTPFEAVEKITSRLKF